MRKKPVTRRKHAICFMIIVCIEEKYRESGIKNKGKSNDYKQSDKRLKKTM